MFLLCLSIRVRDRAIDTIGRCSLIGAQRSKQWHCPQILSLLRASSTKILQRVRLNGDAWQRSIGYTPPLGTQRPGLREQSVRCCQYAQPNGTISLAPPPVQ